MPPRSVKDGNWLAMKKVVRPEPETCVTIRDAMDRAAGGSSGSLANPSPAATNQIEDFYVAGQLVF